MALLSVAGCAGSGSIAAVSPGGTGPDRQGSLTIGEALRADPRFSDFVRIVDFSGLGYRLNDAKGVTVFAPTNTAFDNTDPTWRTRTGPTSANFDASIQDRDDVIRQTVLTGIHPPSDFIGKLQDVKSLSGRVFQVNGLVDGAITITAGVDSPSGMGFPVRPNRIVHVGSPIAAADGLIYPIDVIIR